MAKSTVSATIEETNNEGKIIETVGDVPIEDVIQACSFYNATIARKIYPEASVQAGADDLPPVRLFDRDTMTFPIGLKARVCEELEGQGVNLKWIDKTELPEATFAFQFKDDQELRDYQRRTVKEILAVGRYGMLECPQGGGKTAIGAAIIAELGVKTLWVVHSSDLVHQVADELKKFLGVKAGKIYGGKRELRTVTVATSQSLKRLNLGKMGWVPVLRLEDEVHHHGAWATFQAMRHIPTYYAYGFSATPIRRDASQLMLEAGYGHIVSTVSKQELQAQGYLAPIDVEVREVTDKLPAGLGQSWQEVYEAGIVHHDERNRLVCAAVQEVLDDGRQVLIDVHALSHIEVLTSDDTKDWGWRQLDCGIVTGSMKSEDRKKLYDQFRAGELRVLMGTVMKEGLDLPATGAIVLAGGGRSKVQTLQQVGRGMRVAEGKTNCRVVDFTDGHHGRLWEHSQDRLKNMQAAGFNVPPDAIRKIAGPSAEIDPTEVEKIRKRQQQLARQQGRNPNQTHEDREAHRDGKRSRKQQRKEEYEAAVESYVDDLPEE